MSITRTARLATSNTSNNSTVAGSVTAATGSSISVIVSNAGGTARTVSGVAWTGGTFTQDATKAFVSGGTITITTEVWSAHNVTGGTNTLTVTFSGNSTGKILLVTEFIPTNGALTTGTNATGTATTNPAITTSSITGTPNSGGQVAWISGLAVVRNNTDAAPTWTNPDNAGQKTGTTSGYLAEGYEMDSGAVTQAGSASMATAAGYGMLLVTYIEPASGGVTVKQLSALGVG